MVVVDASVWVSQFVNFDAHHAATLAWFNHALQRREQIVSPELLLVELAGAVARITGFAEDGLGAASASQSYSFTRMAQVDSELIRLSIVTAAEQRIRGADALYVALALRLGVPLITWDREQRERGRRIIRAMTPEEALEI